MLTPEPADAKYRHEAYALAAADVDALRATGRVALDADRARAHAALAVLAGEQSDIRRDAPTALDVRVVTILRERLERAALMLADASLRARLTAATAALSLTPREVSAPAERHLVSRTIRLDRLLELRAPKAVVSMEAGFALDALAALDTFDHDRRVLARAIAEGGGESFFGVEDVVRILAHKTLSLASHSQTYDAVVELLESDGRANAPGLWELAIGEPLLALQPPALFERAISARGVWDDTVERQVLEADFRDWREWHVCSEPDSLAAAADEMRDALRTITSTERRTISADIEGAFYELVPCDDYVSVLDATLADRAAQAHAAARDGLVLLSRVQRSLSW